MRFSPSLRLTVHMVLTARRWRSLLDEHLRPIGQSAARMEAMYAIARTPDSPQIEIARRIGIEGATLTRMLDSLENEGLIERIAGTTDRRSKYIRLTSAGRTALAGIMDIAGRLRAHFMEALDSTEMENTTHVLETLLDRFERDDFDGRSA